MARIPRKKQLTRRKLSKRKNKATLDFKNTKTTIRISKQERSQYKVLHAQGYSQRQIAEQFGRTQLTVCRWLNRTKNDPSNTGVDDKQRAGRPPKLSLKQKKYIIQQYKRKYRAQQWGVRRIASELALSKHKDAPNVSYSTISRVLNAASVNGKAITIPKKFVVPEKNRPKRLRWIRSMRDEDFSRWIFSDERKISIGSMKHKAWVFPGEHISDIKFAHPVTQMAWTCFSSTGPGRMVFIDGTLTGVKYRNILSRHLRPSAAKLFPTGHWRFQQDNDPKHTSHIVQRWLRQQKIDVVPFPPTSPDLNPIESFNQLWAKEVDQLNPKNKADLQKKMRIAWNKLTVHNVGNLITSMQRRMTAVRKVGGRATKY